VLTIRELVILKSSWVNPLPKQIWNNYKLPPKLHKARPLFENMYRISWHQKHHLTPNFSLTKYHDSLLHFYPKKKFDLIYYDAFGPSELWTDKVFSTIYSWMNLGGILTTYCCKGDVRRSMIKAGFVVSKVPGPPKKREMIHAIKPLSF